MQLDPTGYFNSIPPQSKAAESYIVLCALPLFPQWHAALLFYKKYPYQLDGGIHAANGQSYDNGNRNY